MLIRFVYVEGPSERVNVEISMGNASLLPVS